jgi:hypothetical protein
MGYQRKFRKKKVYRRRSNSTQRFRFIKKQGDNFHSKDLLQQYCEEKGENVL